MEARCSQLGADNPLLDHLNKMPDLAVRMAATLQLYEQGNPDNLGAEHAKHPWSLEREYMLRGMDVIRFFIAEKERLSAPAPHSEELDDAALLLAWMREEGRNSFTRTDVYKSSKHRLRDKRVLDAAIATLTEYGWLTAEPLPRKKGTARTTIRYSLTEDGRHHLRGQAA